MSSYKKTLDSDLNSTSARLNDLSGLGTWDGRILGSLFSSQKIGFASVVFQ